MSIGELVLIGIIILLVVPPEKLPGLARDIGRFFNDVRRNTSGVWEELKKDVPNPAEELRKQKLEAEEYLKFIGSPHGPEGAPLQTANRSLDQGHLDSISSSEASDNLNPNSGSGELASHEHSESSASRIEQTKASAAHKKSDGGTESV